jgi:ABC-type phosphate/phosphonate transport system substrate-binding protein
MLLKGQIESMWDFQKIVFRAILTGILGLGALLIFLGTASGSQDAAKSVKIGVLAKRGTERCLKKWQATAEYLTQEIPGCSFTIVPLAFDQIYPAVEGKKVDFILANPYQYLDLAKKLGAQVTLIKPFEREELLAAVHGLLE